MKKFAFLLLFGCCLRGSAQTLFNYGPYKVDRNEFLWAYHKNNALPGARSLNTYLPLYIDYKLKVRSAMDARLDSGADFLRDQRSFRRQLADQTMRRLEGIGRLSQEALRRGQTDVAIAQVFVGFTRPGDTVEAYQRITAALQQLTAGVDFAGVAATYGTNPQLKATGGYTGYITAFSLPYAAENIIYGLKDGAWSGIYRSHSGYHIFKSLGRRPNPGNLKAAQILVSFPPRPTQAQKDQALATATRVYDSLMHGGNWDSLVRRYSDDKMTYYNDGLLPDFTSGDFDTAFEKAAFALDHNNAVSRPVETSYGYHIIKRIGLQPSLKDSLDNQRWYLLEQKVFYSDRMDAGKAAFAESLLPRLRYHAFRFDTAWLFRTTDTLLRDHGGDEFIKHVHETALFSLDGKTFTSTDWFRYLLYQRTGDIREQVTASPALLRSFLHISVLTWFQDNLDRYDADYRYQAQEFAEGTLLFSITQTQVWNKATDDSLQLHKWFDRHRERFNLHPSADILSFTATDSAAIDAFRASLSKDPAHWRTVLGAYPAVTADSTHADLQALSIDSSQARPGLITTPAFQPDNRWHSYALLRLYPSRPAANYDEVKGLVLSDYQTFLEQQWLAALRKKYPVTVNKTLLAQLH
ncbi:MAG TPA: peptidylprolyl isomerase [Dinghuibacter sp.]|uniref:peptidylprolyl isomerase n=1 Tax=Dinghuibacter sp. TaxID=2024697 RepID=UPI002CE14444|nr:peptidylprolyl isomerase [Dinghuibacter sp.]HTJ10717.1 peptidylprolyl isomerase [Dinghuibacter sp.]